MKTNLLFIMPNLTSGGGEKSLVTLLSKIDLNLYNVDLFLLNHSGLFMDFIPKGVHLLPIAETHHLFTLPLFQSLKKLLLKGNGLLAYNRIMFSLRNRNVSNTSKREQYSWKYIAKSLEKIQKKYDVAIGFLEKTSTYFCIDKVDAAKKIGWVHIDYDQLGMDSQFDQVYFQKLDHIVTVSEECANILENRFPDQKNKVEVIYNIVSPSMINEMANQDNLNVYDKKDNEIIILSIGRLHYQKGFEMAVESCKKLIDRGYKIKWNIIGDGEERGKLMELIEEYHLHNHFKLLGLKSNPYPYIKQADIYAQTSKFEGKSIAIDEAKILNKPILVTNFSTAKDQINDGTDGLIIDMNADAIAVGIEKLINDTNLRKKLTLNLACLKKGTEEEIDKFYGLLNR
ncbi:glycosyltransferase [Paenibacillus sp. GP183]|uniref:glycosyltransferase n=1 Tax=Paenibacillus sp. GP183 TaxID=1882751 RepID=UPI000899C2A5|nr:glycosyltransferase [Paenibacillus sp. GP183]SEC07484.1 Glycosyl transferases group 1 [Paenibacillus sp. GP183]